MPGGSQTGICFLEKELSVDLVAETKKARQDSLEAEIGGEGPHLLGCLAMHTFCFLFKPYCQVRNFEDRFG